MSIRWGKLALAVILCQLAGLLGSFFTISSVTGWYAGLAKPFFSPPNWVFGPVWIILYALMGISLYILWEQGTQNTKVKLALHVFFVQLILNAVWSPVFFGAQNIFLALVIILLLWLSILVTMALFFPLSKKAALLLIPYFLWVSFATALNYSLWVLNG
jgi:translocator protein